MVVALCTESVLSEFVMDTEAWRAVVHGVAKSRIRLSNWTELINSIYICQSQSPTTVFSLSIHMFVLYICVSISAFQMISSIPFFFSRFHIYALMYFVLLFLTSFTFWCTSESITLSEEAVVHIHNGILHYSVLMKNKIGSLIEMNGSSIDFF